MKQSAALPFFGLVALTLGCAVASAVKVSDRTYAPIQSDQVRVFVSEEDVSGPYEKVAIITSEGDYDFSGKPALIKTMKKKAAALGANGIILGQFQAPTTGQKIAQAFLWTSANNKYECMAIRLKSKKRPIREESDE